ncbi:hypothetical protein A2Z67_05210 [Candidatus Woesebacteria bacterium RBG_13_36_22]|uniref:Putative phage metallopeptidase domain-containing protein n=1 Tax=Candidatus Woesebacteria bacterium RBG_13_36_22 TaxID=1802478 RepID=A0A1F7X2V7_9BACT|nr:MAG: hypothetical protein A2Z67_05210 [Candidatus Woesebacteria bacterium RBG_13_36_22]
MEFERAPEVADIARNLLPRFHRHLVDGNARLAYLFRDRAWKTTSQRVILGKASKRSEIDKFLSAEREDFIIIIAKPEWDRLSSPQKEILVDHELCHCGVLITNTGAQKWIILDHPIEEFPEILQRHESKRIELGALIEHPPDKLIVSQTPVRRRRIRPRSGEEATTEEN